MEEKSKRGHLICPHCNNRINPPNCKCGGKIVKNDNHYICNEYLEDLKIMLYELGGEYEEDY